MKNYEMSWIRAAIRLLEKMEGNHNERSCKQKDRNAPAVQPHFYSGYGFKLIISVSVLLFSNSAIYQQKVLSCSSVSQKIHRTIDQEWSITLVVLYWER